MRVGIVTYNINAEAGGGATFYFDVISALKGISCSHEFYYITLNGKSELDKNTIALEYSNKWIRLLKRVYNKLNQAFALRSKAVVVESEATKALNVLIRQHKIDLLYFPIPTFIKSECPSIITLWDLAHRVYPFFPEVSYQGWTWDERENFYRDSLPRAAAVITGTEAGKQQAIRYYNLTQERIFVNPFFAARFTHETNPVNKAFKESTEKQKYLFYPAQFWSHKNHANLLQALRIVKEQKAEIKLVFCGSDKGNLNHVKSLIKNLHLEQAVEIRGFVSVKELVTLYQNAEAVIFPSFFGPDNLPPLEAMALGCPVAAADIEGAREQLGDAALYFHPESPASIAEAIMEIITDTHLRKQLIKKGQLLAKSRTPEDYVQNLLQIFDQLEPFRQCWPNSSIP